MIEVNKKIAEEHGLTSEEYDKICSLLKKTPNLTELGIFSAMWNEHCSYKSSRFHLKKLNTNGKKVIQGPGENAGVVDIEDNNLIPFKYCNKEGSINESSNPNGSLNNIAGILNNKKNILGMMPHPERMVDKLISNTDGVNLFSSLLD